MKGDLSYFYKDDDSYRKIRQTPVQVTYVLVITENFLTDARRDRIAFSIDTLRSAVIDKVIGSTTENYFSVMGALQGVVENLIQS